MSEPSKFKVFGHPVRRLEDRALITGAGRYLDDLRPDGCLAGAFLRSPHPHARFTRIDTEAARSMPGVVRILTAEDIAPYLTHERLVALSHPALKFDASRPILARDEVAYSGEAIALVVAATRSQAEDAAEAIEVDFEPLPASSDCRDALRPDAAVVRLEYPHNRVADLNFGYGDIEAAFARAAHTVSGTYDVHRGAAQSMEGRGVLARPDPMGGTLQVWSSTQAPQGLKSALGELLRLEDSKLRVITPNIGGGFGTKLITYQEEIAIPLAAMILGRPVKWVEDRQEHFLTSVQERDQHWDVEMAFDAEGRILGVRGTMIHDHGAYTARGVNVPYGSGLTLPLCYNVPAYSLKIAVALTNKVPVAALRGAGQPQAAFVMERMLDRAAAQLGLERPEIRARNLVRPEQMPAKKGLKLRGGTEVMLDSGNYPATQAMALESVAWGGFGARKQIARAEGRSIGIGLANYVEATGRGPYESVTVRIARSGTIEVVSGAVDMGQGFTTIIAQVVAEQLGADPHKIIVRSGDTDNRPGFGGFNSRQTVVAGASAHKAAIAVRRKLLRVASHLMEVHEDDLEVAGNRVELKGAVQRNMSFAELAAAADGLAGYPLPGIDEPGIAATEAEIIHDMAFTNGSAVAEVEVDRETGAVKVVHLTLAHDCGRMVNPLLVEGQLIGGIAHGLGNALFEHMHYDAQAQPLTGTLADYLLVTAGDMPVIEMLHQESPSPLNALGVKGVGESGTIPAAAAIMSAVDDALSDLGLHTDCAPLSPQVLRERIRALTAGTEG